MPDGKIGRRLRPAGFIRPGQTGKLPIVRREHDGRAGALEHRRVLRDGAAVELTETELSILQYLAAQKGKVVSVNDIYENVWHEKYMPASNNTVMVHIVNLRKKLERNPAEPRLIRTVWGKGYQID